MLGFAMKKIIIIAGPNGAGKTTFAREFLPNEAGCPKFVNADLIAAGLSPFAPDVAAMKAARIMLESIKELEERGESFAFETTLSGLTYAHRIRRWREAGYHVTLFFLSLPNSQMAIDRVAERVRQVKLFVDVLQRGCEILSRFIVMKWMLGCCMTMQAMSRC